MATAMPVIVAGRQSAKSSVLRQEYFVPICVYIGEMEAHPYWAAAFEREYGRIRGFLRRRVSDPDVADDLASATFVRAIERENQLRNSFALRAWLFSIARHLLADAYRRDGRQLGELEEAANATTGAGPERAVSRQELHAALRARLDQLSARDRQVLILKFGENLTNRRIAQMLDLSEGNIAKIVYRALRSLRAHVADWRPEDVFHSDG
jgi:RNA polymerase sigma-70 factor (ECF subfamily)